MFIVYLFMYLYIYIYTYYLCVNIYIHIYIYTYNIYSIKYLPPSNRASIHPSRMEPRG